jgi:hypothetical protein
MSDPVKIEALAPAAAPVLDEAVSEKIRQYNKAARLAKLSSILLEKMDFRTSPEALRADPSELKRELNVETQIMDYDAPAGSCVATISWSITLRHKRKKVASCKVTYVVLYYEIKDFAEDIIKMFIDHVGKTATYAYFRALYAHLDWSANLGSPPLPVMSFLPTAKDMRSPPPESAEERE